MELSFTLLQATQSHMMSISIPAVVLSFSGHPRSAFSTFVILFDCALLELVLNQVCETPIGFTGIKSTLSIQNFKMLLNLMLGDNSLSCSLLGVACVKRNC